MSCVRRRAALVDRETTVRNNQELATIENPVLTVVPGYVAYPPELSYPPRSHTNEPAAVIRERGKSRLVYIPGNIEATMWLSGHTDLSQLLLIPQARDRARRT